MPRKSYHACECGKPKRRYSEVCHRCKPRLRRVPCQCGKLMQYRSRSCRDCQARLLYEPCKCGKPKRWDRATCWRCRPKETTAPVGRHERTPESLQKQSESMKSSPFTIGRRLVIGGTCKRDHLLVGENVRYRIKHGERFIRCWECEKAWGRKRAKEQKNRVHPVVEPPARVVVVDPNRPMYLVELERVKAKRAAQMAAIHEDVQRRLGTAVTLREWVGYMTPGEEAA
jgi:hypothetical protein